MCDVIRERPDGEDENDEDEDELDPRVEIELEKLNKASIEINILEKELDESRAVFRQRLTDAAKHLKQLAKTIGNNIDKARPYFEALSQSKKAQADCQDAAVTYEKACQLHKGARDTIAVAEEKMMSNPSMFDSAWQEMLNNANARLLEAEKEKMIKEEIHRESTLAYLELESRASQLEKKLRKAVNKARPYFEQRAQSLGYLEKQKHLVQELELSYTTAKKQYADSLRNLEIISEEIHNKRSKKAQQDSLSTQQQLDDFPSPVERGECVGAETDQNKSPSRRNSELRRMSEEKIKTALLRHRSVPTSALGRYRHSLLLDLDVDFDIDDSDYSDETPKSPGSKSVDMGCMNMKYYDDYQVLDVFPFLEREKQSTPERKANTSRSGTVLSTASTAESSDFDNVSLQTRSRSASEFEVISNKHYEHDSLEQLHRSNTAPSLSRRNTRPVIISMDDIAEKVKNSSPEKSKNPLNNRKGSRPVLITRFSMIEEQEDSIDALDNLPPIPAGNSGGETNIYKKNLQATQVSQNQSMNDGGELSTECVHTVQDDIEGSNKTASDNNTDVVGINERREDDKLDMIDGKPTLASLVANSKKNKLLDKDPEP